MNSAEIIKVADMKTLQILKDNVLKNYAERSYKLLKVKESANSLSVKFTPLAGGSEYEELFVCSSEEV